LGRLEATTRRAAISGDVVKISGETVISKISGEFVYTSVEAAISGQSVIVTSGEVRALISGDVVVAKISGETVIAKISGETVISKISGESVVATSGEVRALISGDVVVGKISGETVISKISGETVVAKISGEVVDIKVPTEVKTNTIRTITGNSGGEVLHSGSVVSVTIKALSSNSGDIYVGGATNRPYSGYGFLLEPGEAVNLDVSDFDDVYLFACVSGDKVTFLGIV